MAKKRDAGMSSDQARQKHSELNHNPGFQKAYFDRDHPNHREAVTTIRDVLDRRKD